MVKIVKLSMLLMLLAGQAAACPATVLENETSDPINPLAISGATKTCRVRYKKCLKKLIKKPGHENYWAICGGSLNND